VYDRQGTSGEMHAFPLDKTIQIADIGETANANASSQEERVARFARISIGARCTLIGKWRFRDNARDSFRSAEFRLDRWIRGCSPESVKIRTGFRIAGLRRHRSAAVTWANIHFSRLAVLAN